MSVEQLFMLSSLQPISQKISFNIMLPYMYASLEWFSFERILYAFHGSSIQAAYPTHITLLGLITLSSLG
jgi:hypothetical protein